MNSLQQLQALRREQIDIVFGFAPEGTPKAKKRTQFKRFNDESIRLAWEGAYLAALDEVWEKWYDQTHNKFLAAMKKAEDFKQIQFDLTERIFLQILKDIRSVARTQLHNQMRI